MIASLSDAQTIGDFPEAERLLGSSGQIQEGAMVLVIPQSDIKVTVHGETIPTTFGFGSWTVCTNMGSEMVIMGDFVLLE